MGKKRSRSRSRSRSKKGTASIKQRRKGKITRNITQILQVLHALLNETRRKS